MLDDDTTPTTPTTDSADPAMGPAPETVEDPATEPGADAAPEPAQDASHHPDADTPASPAPPADSDDVSGSGQVPMADEAAAAAPSASPDGPSSHEPQAAPVKAPRRTTRKAGPRTTKKAASGGVDPTAAASSAAETPSAQEAAEDGALLSAEQVSQPAPGADPAPSTDEGTGSAGDADETAGSAGDATEAPAKKAATRKTAAKRAPAKKAAAKRTTTRKTAASRQAEAAAAASPGVEARAGAEDDAPAVEPTAGADDGVAADGTPGVEPADAVPTTDATSAGGPVPEGVPEEVGDEADATPPPGPAGATSLLFKAPVPVSTPRRTRVVRTTKTVQSDAQRAAAAEAGEAAPTDEVATPAPARRGSRGVRTGSRASELAGDRVQVGATAGEEDGEVASDRIGTRDDAASAVTAPGPDVATGADTDVTEDDLREPTGDTDATSDAAGAAPDGDDARADDDRPDEAEDTDGGENGDGQGGRRRRRRGGRRRRRSGSDDANGDSTSDQDGSGDATSGADDVADSDTGEADDTDDEAAGDASARRSGGRGRGGQRGERGSGAARSEEQDAEPEEPGTRRRRRRRRAGEEVEGTGEEPNTVVRVRKPRNAEDEITSLQGSTRLEAKKQRRREGREAGRRRAPIVSEAEFLARREAVERVMVIRQKKDLTQIAVLEDSVLVEHYVARKSQTSLIGNVYLGRVQNVLPSMEAAFIDIGKGRNAVLYAGEVNWDLLGAGNGPRKIEQVLKSGQPILVQVSKDPIGHKGARLTSQVTLPGRFLVYVPDGTTSGISRKLPDTERARLKSLLKEIVPDSAGVIVRTAAEGAAEEDLRLDVERLTARWADIEAKIAKAPKTGGSPQLLYGEPDLTLKVVRDLFTEDFGKLVVAGDEAWNLVRDYVQGVAPDLEQRLERYDGAEDVFATYRVDEQIAKGLDRKVWLPSGGSLVIDRTEAMTVVDVNTGKFTGSGGNLEETVTKNNLEAAEEMVRQLRLRDIGGIIVIDFIDMVLESNRDLVLRRLVECLGRDRTRHQVAEVTSLGLVQMTRKRIGTGLVESFSEPCDHCAGRGVVIAHEPVEPRQSEDEPRRGGRRGRGRGAESDTDVSRPEVVRPTPSPKDIAAMARHEPRPVEAVEAMGAVGSAESTAAGSEPVASSEATSPAQATTPAEAVMADDPAAPEASEVTEATEATEPLVVSGAAEPAQPEEPEQGQSEQPEPEQPGESAPADPAGQADVAEQAQEAAVAPSFTPERPAQPAVGSPEPAGPRLVTSTRRRVARRPAGPPVAVSAAASEVPVASSNGGDPGSPPAGDPAKQQDALDGGGARGDGSTGDHDQPEAESEASERVHVPIKRRGRKH